MNILIIIGMIILLVLEIMSINNMFEDGRLRWIILSVILYVGISEYTFIIMLYTIPIF